MLATIWANITSNAGFPARHFASSLDPMLPPVYSKRYELQHNTDERSASYNASVHGETAVPVDEFRTLRDMSSPDDRHRHIVIVDRACRRIRPITATDYRRNIARFKLTNAVPPDIRIQWDNARNLLLYAWHVWRFYNVAEMQAYATLEYGLRIRLGHDKGKKRPGFKIMLEEAIRRNLITGSGIEYHRIRNGRRTEMLKSMEITYPDRSNAIRATMQDPDPQAYCLILLDSLPALRNKLAHGSSTLSPFSVSLTFSLCRDLLEMLFDGSDQAIPPNSSGNPISKQ